MFSIKPITTQRAKEPLCYQSRNSYIKPLNRLFCSKELHANNGKLKAENRDLDSKDFGVGAQILHDLNISNIRF